MLKEDGTAYLNVLKVLTSIEIGGQPITATPSTTAENVSFDPTGREFAPESINVDLALVEAINRVKTLEDAGGGGGSTYPKILGSNRIYEDNIEGTSIVSENITIDSAGDYLASITIQYTAISVGGTGFKFLKNGNLIVDPYNDNMGATSKIGSNIENYVSHLKSLAVNDVITLQSLGVLMQGAKIKVLLQKIDATSNIQENTISTGGGA